ncbi:MAG: polysaccharide deacetylase family protein [Clostridia bacterium]|nr:polysaccharide deacetylase family protein [Clostridia bacterium]
MIDFWSKHRRWLLSAVLFILTVAIFYTTQSGQAVLTASATRQLPIYCVEKDSKVCSLSFDAAWGNEDTQQLIDILGKYNIRATFFVVGEWVDKYPESVKALHDAGHEVHNHSDNHPHMTELTEQQIIENVSACDDKIEAVTGVRPFLFRPPYGDYNDQVINTLRSMGHYPIQWDVDSLDWKESGTQDIIDRVLGKVQPGSIVLFHNAAKYTPQALPSVIEGLIREGYSFVPISELIYRENYELDHTGRQIPCAPSDAS